jgi:hypothetical protein
MPHLGFGSELWLEPQRAYNTSSCEESEDGGGVNRGLLLPPPALQLSGRWPSLKLHHEGSDPWSCSVSRIGTYPCFFHMACFLAYVLLVGRRSLALGPLKRKTRGQPSVFTWVSLIPWCGSRLTAQPFLCQWSWWLMRPCFEWLLLSRSQIWLRGMGLGH